MPNNLRRYGVFLLVVVVLVAVIWSGASLLADRVAASPAAQATPAFGPVITAPPSNGAPAASATPQPASPTPVPSDTPAEATVTSKPKPKQASATPEATPTVTPFVIQTPLPALRADLMGIQIDPNIPADAFETMLWLTERIGVKWIKFQFDWSILEPQQGALSADFTRYQSMLKRADQGGFKVLASVVKAPGWARTTNEEAGPPADPAALGRFITLMQNTMGGDPYGASYFDAIEVWNEPNLRREWNGGTLGGADYMRLFDATYHAIRASIDGPNIIVVTAGLAPTGINDGTTAIDDREFLRQMYNAGLNNSAYYNVAIGVHPYGAANPPDARCCGGGQGYDGHPTWFFLDTLEDYHAIMQQYGDTGRQLWATEFGWGTWDGFLTQDGQPAPPPADPPYFGWITEEQQGNFTIRAFEIGQSLPYLGPMMLWNLNYGGQAYVDLQNEQAAYAIIKETDNPLRPVFIMIESAPKQ